MVCTFGRVDCGLAAHDIVDGANDNGRSLSKSNGIRSDTNKLEKVDPPPNVKLDTPTGPKPIENKRYPFLENFQIKVQRVDKNLQHSDSKADEPPTQPKGHKRGSERQPKTQSRSHRTATSPSRASNQGKVIASTVAKSSARQPSSNSSKPSVPDKARDPETDSKRKKDNTSTDLPRNGDAFEKAKRPAKDLPKSSSMSPLKSSHLSKSSHAHVSKKNSTDIKEP
ncbi:hypothetical protein Tco_0453964 [Tanacetum coccineum]